MKNKLKLMLSNIKTVEHEKIMFNLYCILIFLSQFSYILSFNVAGKNITPVKIFALFMLVYDIARNHGKIEYNKNKKNPWLIMMLIWNIWTIISIFWAKSKTGTLSVEVIFFEALLFIYYGNRLIKTKKQCIKVLNVLFFALLIHIILCCLELNFGIYLFSIYTKRYLLRKYPVSTFTNTNNLACYLSLMLFLLIFAYHMTKDKKQKIYYIILMLSSIIINFFTKSRGSIIAVILGLILFGILCLREHLKRKKIVINKKIIIGILSFIFIVGIFLIVNPSSRKYINKTINDSFSINMTATSGSDFYRMNAYLNGLDFFVDSNGLGISPGNVEYWMENYGTRYTKNVKPLHNWWLEILVASGLLVFSIMLYIWIVQYKKLIKMYLNKNKKFNKSEIIQISSLIAFGLVFAISCISPSSLYKIEWPWALLSTFFLMSDWFEIFKNER